MPAHYTPNDKVLIRENFLISGGRLEFQTTCVRKGGSRKGAKAAQRRKENPWNAAALCVFAAALCAFGAKPLPLEL
jgi:hypothetical protein